MRPTVYLFDIDGTILLTGGAGRRSFEHAFAQVTGIANACDGFSFGGMTDRAIARNGLLAVGWEVSDATIEALFEAYLARLESEVRLTQGYRVMPHVVETVTHLRSLAGAAIGLGTGNLRRGAKIKLDRADLFRLFDFGGFGCDHEDRTELLRAGAERGALQLGVPRTSCRVVVVGDTVRDVVAAHGIGAECVAVTTGGVAAEVLSEAGADSVFTDLSDPGAIEVLVG